MPDRTGAAPVGGDAGGNGPISALSLLRGEILRPRQSGIDRRFRQALAVADIDVERCRAWIGLAAGLRVTDRFDEAFAMLDKAADAAAGDDLAVGARGSTTCVAICASRSEDSSSACRSMSGRSTAPEELVRQRWRRVRLAAWAMPNTRAVEWPAHIDTSAGARSCRARPAPGASKSPI